MKLAEALEPIVEELKEPEAYLQLYDQEYERVYIDKMRKKVHKLSCKIEDKYQGYSA